MAVRLAGLFYILNGFSMLIVWPVLISTGGVPELKTQFIYMVFHLAAEVTTATVGIITGVGMLLRRDGYPEEGEFVLHNNRWAYKL